MINIDEVRRKYPHPKSVICSDSRLNDYCVLGAALRFLFEDIDWYGFPCPTMAAIHLNIPEAAALRIARANDSGKFERAWELLGRELRRAGAGMEREEEELVLV